jgi:hypothetical protein
VVVRALIEDGEIVELIGWRAAAATRGLRARATVPLDVIVLAARSMLGDGRIGGIVPVCSEMKLFLNGVRAVDVMSLVIPIGSSALRTAGPTLQYFLTSGEWRVGSWNLEYLNWTGKGLMMYVLLQHFGVYKLG